MAKSKIVQTNEKIAGASTSCYRKVEHAAVSGYKRIECFFVNGYRKIEDAFVERYLIHDGETVEDAKMRLKAGKVG